MQAIENHCLFLSYSDWKILANETCGKMTEDERAKLMEGTLS